MKLLWLFGAIAGISGAQVCAPGPEIKTAIDKIQKLEPDARLPAARALLNRHPGDFWVQSLSFEAIPEREARIRETARVLAKHPEDARYLYFAGSSLVGARTPDAIRYLEGALVKNPALGPAHIRLATIYSSENFTDPEKLRAHVAAYLKACPNADLAMYTYLEKIDDAELQAESALTLRQALESRPDPADWSYYPILWKLKPNVLPLPEQRARIRRDLERLRTANLNESPRAGWELADGYELLGDEDGLKWIDSQVLWRSVRRFDTEHPNPMFKPGARYSQEAMLQWYRQRATASAEWVQRWPDDVDAWRQRYNALAGSRAPVAEIQIAIDNYLRTGRKSPDPAGAIFLAARNYLRWKLRMDQLDGIVKEGLDELDRRKVEPPDDLARMRFGINSESSILRWRAQGLDVLAEVYDVTHRPELMERTLARSKDTLDAIQAAGFPEKYRETEWNRSYADYWNKMGRCAEQQGRTRDAMRYYLKASDPALYDNGLNASLANDARNRARELWTASGGSDEGWLKWTRENQKVPPDVLSEALGKDASEKGQALPEFRSHDLAGKSWTLADLKGKITFINLWATWCGPCHEELPLVQKIFDQVKNRRDIQVLTFNSDVDQSLVAPFLKAHGYTFPVMPAIRGVGSGGGIPRNWIVDREGVIQSATLGFYASYEAEWQEHMLMLLDELARNSAKP